MSKWFLVLLLSFSFSSFAGFVANNYSDYQQPAKTEQIILNDNTSIHSLSFGQLTTTLFHSGFRATFALDYALCISIYHERLAAVRLKNLTEQRTHFKSFITSQPVKTIPEYSDQDPAHLIIG